MLDTPTIGHVHGFVKVQIRPKVPGQCKSSAKCLASPNIPLDFASSPLYPHERSERLERSEWSLCATSAKNEGDVVPLPDGRPTASELTRGVPNEGDRYNPYAIHPQVVKRTREVVEGATRRARRRALALSAQVTYLAVMDPESGASTQDRLKAADGAARVSGLVREGGTTKVSLVVTFKGLRRNVVDADAIEARVVEAAGLPPLARQEGSGGGGEGG